MPNVSGIDHAIGYAALANNNLTYPAIAMGTNGKGVIAFSVLGGDYYPSAGYATIDAKGNVVETEIVVSSGNPVLDRQAQAIARAESPAQALSLLFVSPEMLRR